MSSRFELSGRTTVVTGAGGGIGAAVAVSLARRGCHLALADIDAAGLERTAEAVTGFGTRLTTHRLDVSDAEAVAAFPALVRARHERADLLVNNAGVALGGMFEEVDPDDFEWLFEVNFFGVVRMTRAFLPLLREAGGARIVNLSSIFGIVALPGRAAYAASKFAVRGFSEALRHELEGSGIGVSVVHPGGVRTGIAASARAPKSVTADEVERRRRSFEKHLRLPAAKAGEIIVKGIEARRARILVGSDARQLALVERLIPVNYWRLLKRRLAA